MINRFAEKLFATLILAVACTIAPAVTSKIVRQDSAAEFQKGQTKDVVIGSTGTLELGPASQTLCGDLADSWTVNALITDAAGSLYIGTSPNGCIYKYAGGTLKKLYPADANKAAPVAKDKRDANDPNAAGSAGQKYLTNEHIFAMGLDSAGRVLAGVSGKHCKLLRIDGEKCESIFEPNDADYVFAIITDSYGTIYLGTGPHGSVYRLDKSGRKPEVVYHATDKNILSLLIGGDGLLYAGSDERGIVYRIDPATKTAVVLYDAEQSEITSMLFDAQGNLYAAATSASATKSQRAPLENQPGKPETAAAPATSPHGTLQLAAPQTPKRPAEDDQAKLKALLQQTATPSAASHIYKINREGFVTDVFKDAAVFFAIAARENQILIGTGSKGQLLSIDPATEQKEILYADLQASQVTALCTSNDAVYLGTANPARIIKLARTLAATGTYTSSLIDAGQPAKWGKFQVEAAIAPGSHLQVSARTGNVGDVNDPTYSAWTSPRDVNDPVLLDVPTARFCQYKLIFTPAGQSSPVVREVIVPYMIPNLAPQVDAVTVARSDSPDKQGVFTISYKASDRNGDKLIYRIDIRKVGLVNWIKVKDSIESDSYVWDSKTVEDGRYKIKVTASDERSNTPTTKLTASRVSDPVIVDNTPPTIAAAARVDVKEKTATIRFTAVDALSIIAAVSYTVDSNADWIATLPDDQVYDTLSEDFTIVAADLSPGQHIIAVKVVDAAGNAMYKTFEVDIPAAAAK